MDIVFALVIFVGLVGLAGLTFWLWSQTNQRMNSLSDKLTESLQVDRGTSESFGQIQRTLGELSKSSQNMEALGKEISGLSDLLKAPKLRGGIGELFLGDLLAQMLSPENYQLQYTFPGGGPQREPNGEGGRTHGNSRSFLKPPFVVQKISCIEKDDFS
jgi:hypothetical protein